ncbi:phospholipase D-like domain-containing protein [Pedobacter sp. SL55]|uniref:phospholipase D-like domain-containing protein n=1 Tax=Pedobacter sp. SL55 TaxID=2995161 RepID=UPI002271E997|nr:phospholipase D-like domain-containing protein [Pedobacter sp. SL55]WAC41096.1 phospholipase D-like domain-containing protein [Pedobacter sp. SL55]
MSEVYFKNISNVIDNNLKQAKFEIKIAVAWITDTRLLSTLKTCIKNGVKVYIVFYENKNNNVESFEELFDLGASIRYSKKLMHNKFCVIDEVVTINGSYNWTFSAKTNDENIQITKSHEIAVNFLKEFEKIYLSSVSIDKHFADKKSLFEQYLKEIGMPKSYPVFYKQSLDNNFNGILFNGFSNQIKHIYRLFTKESEFINYHKNIYDYLFTVKDKYSLRSSLKYNFYSKSNNKKESRLWNKIQGGKYLVIDIIESKFIGNINPSYLLDNEKKLMNEKFFYFNPATDFPFFLVCLYPRYYVFSESDQFKEMLKLGVLKFNEHSIDDIVQFKFGDLTIENNFIVNSYKEINQREYVHKIFIDKNSFSLNEDLEIQNVNKEFLKIREEIEKRKAERVEHNRKMKQQENNCFIATMVYKDNNHINIQALRDYRDRKLKNNSIGRIFIRVYYKYSPALVEKVGDKKSAIVFFKFIIEKLILKFIIGFK